MNQTVVEIDDEGSSDENLAANYIKQLKQHTRKACNPRKKDLYYTQQTLEERDQDFRSVMMLRFGQLDPFVEPVRSLTEVSQISKINQTTVSVWTRLFEDMKKLSDLSQQSGNAMSEREWITPQLKVAKQKFTDLIIIFNKPGQIWS